MEIVIILSVRANFYTIKCCNIESLWLIFYCFNRGCIYRSIVRETRFVCFSILCSVYCRNIINMFACNTIIGISVLATFYTSNFLSISINNVFCYIIVCACSYLFIANIVYTKNISFTLWCIVMNSKIFCTFWHFNSNTLPVSTFFTNEAVSVLSVE